MGPRFFNRGNDWNEVYKIFRYAGLQWGRGFSTAEMA